MIGSIAIEACVSQYASSRCFASSVLKLSALTRTKPMSPIRSTRDVGTADWPHTTPAVHENKKSSLVVQLFNGAPCSSSRRLNGSMLEEAPEYGKPRIGFHARDA